MKYNKTVQILDKHPQLAHQLHIMTGSQLHYAQEQQGVIDNSINPNVIYDSTITRQTNGYFKYNNLQQIELRHRLHNYLIKEYQKVNRDLQKSSRKYKSKPKDINKGTKALRALNTKEWNKINDILDHSKVKHNSISAQQFNNFSNHKQNINENRSKKKHHEIRDTHDAYEDTSFGRDISTDASTQSLKPVATHGIQGVSKLKSLALKINPAVITGILVAKQMISSIKRHHDKKINNVYGTTQSHRKINVRPNKRHTLNKSQILRQRRYKMQQSERHR